MKFFSLTLLAAAVQAATTTTKASAATCTNIVQNPGFDAASSAPWSFSSFPSNAANAQSPSKYAPFVYQNKTSSANICTQNFAKFDFSKTYSGYFYIKVATFAPNPVNPTATPCNVGAMLGSATLLYQNIGNASFKNWTKVSFSNVKPQSQSGSLPLYFGLQCDSDYYVRTGKVEVWYDTFFIKPDTC